MANPDQWARNLEREIEQRDTERANNDAAFVAKQKVITIRGPQLWEELLTAFQQSCDAYNRNKVDSSPILQFSRQGAHHFIVRPDGDLHEVAGEYDWQSRSIGIGGNASAAFSDIYDPKIDTRHGEDAVLFSRSDGRPILPADIARKSLEQLVKTIRG